MLAHAHRRTGCRGRGVTVSRPQWQYASQAHRGLPIAFSLADYRDPSIDAHGPFDRIVSIGMFEHVGAKNHRAFFARAAALLADDGLFLLHTMGNRARTGVDPWIDWYIFPNSAVPCVRDVSQCIDEFFVLEDWHTFGDDYEHTLMAWAHNFDQYAKTREFAFDRRYPPDVAVLPVLVRGIVPRAQLPAASGISVLSKKGTRGGYRSGALSRRHGPKYARVAPQRRAKPDSVEPRAPAT